MAHHGKKQFSKPDEGKITVGVSNRLVIINFSFPVSWVGLAPGRARALAITLMSYADEIRKVAPDGLETTLVVDSLE